MSRDGKGQAGAGHGWRTRHIETYIPLVAAILVCWALCLYRLEGKSLWFDELGTLTGAAWRGPWQDAIRIPLGIRGTAKPPLPFLVTHLFLYWDQSVFALRLPSALFATATVPVLYALGTRVLNRRIGLLSALLLAIAPLHIRYAQEARMYAQLGFLCASALYLFYRATKSQRQALWFAFVLAAAAALHTHFFALLPLASLGIIALWILLRPKAQPSLSISLKTAGWVLAALTLLYLPLVPYLVQGFWGDEGLGGNTVPGWNARFLTQATRVFGGGTGTSVWLYSLLFLLGAIALFVKRRAVWLILLTWFLLPLVAILGPSYGHGVRIRYLIFLLPAYLLIVAVGLDQVARSVAVRLNEHRPHVLTSWNALALILMVVGTTWPSIPALYREEKQDWRTATKEIAARAAPGDTIYVTHTYHREGVLFYTKSTANSAYQPSVQLLPSDSQSAFPLSAEQGYWLIVPLRDKFKPGGSLDTDLAPYRHLGQPLILTPTNIPREAELFAPTSYRQLTIIEVLPDHPPVIQMEADKTSLAPGTCTWLRWDAQNVREVYLQGRGVIGQGQQEVCPAETTTYTLLIIHQDSSVSNRMVEIQVDADSLSP